MNAANTPGEFVTFLGMEYTNHSTGHFTCVFDGDQLPKDPIISSRLPVIGAGQDTPNELWEVLDDFTGTTGSRALALPHHTVRESYMQDWTYYDPEYVKIAEVTSNHGADLYEPDHPLSYLGSTGAPPPGTRGCSITDALKMGLHLSLYASSDSHDGHPGHSLSHTATAVGHQRPYTYWWTRYDKPYPVGLTAVYAGELTRDAVFSALVNRNIYANSDHGRPVLKFSVNGVEVGGDSTVRVASADTPRELSIFLAQCGSPASTLNTPASVSESWQPNWNAGIEILKNGDLLTTIEVTEPVAAVRFVDREPVTGTAFSVEDCVLIDGEYYINHFSDNPVDPQTLNTGGKDFYIIRVVGENHRHSYIGPIWVDVE